MGSKVLLMLQAPPFNVLHSLIEWSTSSTVSSSPNCVSSTASILFIRLSLQFPNWVTEFFHFPLHVKVRFSSAFLSLYWIHFPDRNLQCYFIQQYICIFSNLTIEFIPILFKFLKYLFIPSSILVNYYIIIIIMIRAYVRKLWTCYELWKWQSTECYRQSYPSLELLPNYYIKT